MSVNQGSATNLRVRDRFNGPCFVATIVLVLLYYVILEVMFQFTPEEIGQELMGRKTPSWAILFSAIPLLFDSKMEQLMSDLARLIIIRVLHIGALVMALWCIASLFRPSLAGDVDVAKVHYLSTQLTEKCRPYAAELQLQRADEDFGQDIQSIQQYRRTVLYSLLEDNKIYIPYRDAYVAAINQLGTDSLSVLCQQLGGAQRITLTVEKTIDTGVSVDRVKMEKELMVPRNAEIVDLQYGMPVRYAGLMDYLDAETEANAYSRAHVKKHIRPIWWRDPSSVAYPVMKFAINN